MLSEHQSQTRNDFNFFRYVILRTISCDVPIAIVMWRYRLYPNFLVFVFFHSAPIASLSHFRIYDFIVWVNAMPVHKLDKQPGSQSVCWEKNIIIWEHQSCIVCSHQFSVLETELYHLFTYISPKNTFLFDINYNYEVIRRWDSNPPIALMNDIEFVFRKWGEIFPNASHDCARYRRHTPFRPHTNCHLILRDNVRFRLNPNQTLCIFVAESNSLIPWTIYSNFWIWFTSFMDMIALTMGLVLNWTERVLYGSLDVCSKSSRKKWRGWERFGRREKC